MCQAAESLGVFEDNVKMIRTEAICLNYCRDKDDKQWTDRYECKQRNNHYSVIMFLFLFRGKIKKVVHRLRGDRHSLLETKT